MAFETAIIVGGWGATLVAAFAAVRLALLQRRRVRELHRETEQLRDAVREEHAHVDLRTVDAHVGRLRRALNEGGGPDLIRTVRSVGYSLDDEPA